MTRWISAIAVCAALAQQPNPERFAFSRAAWFDGPRGHHAPAKDLGDHPAKVRAADYTLAYATRNLLPFMRRSAAAGDIGGNGLPAVYIAAPGQPPMLLQEARNGAFHDIPARITALETSLSAAFGDYAHGGRESLFLAGADGITLYRNNGGHFTDTTRKAGLHFPPGVLFSSATLGDLDGDGFPDLLAAAYTDLNHPPDKPVFTFPNDFHGADSRLFRNNGDGTFTDVTVSAGLAKNPGRARKAVFADFNSDRRLDILILRDDKPPVLYLNRGGWKFEDKTWDAGEDLTTHAFFDGAVADFNRDGKPDLAIWSTHSFRLLINQGNAVFELLDSPSLPDPTIGLFGFRGAVADLDGNGFDDVLTVDRSGKWRFFANGNGRFHEAPPPAPGENDSLIPAQFNQSSLYLVAIRQDGGIVLWKQQGALSHSTRK